MHSTSSLREYQLRIDAFSQIATEKPYSEGENVVD